jgi:predicted nucleotidyltransferase
MRDRGTQILKAVVGSFSYGTYIDGVSDIDHKGIYIQNMNDILSTRYNEQYEVGKDEVYYEVRRFLDLCRTGNPNILELLYTADDCIVYKHPIFDIIRENRQKFLTKACGKSFGGYAVSQISKSSGLNKKMNWEKEKITRKTLFDFCFYTKDGKSFPIEKYFTERNRTRYICNVLVRT